MTVPVVSRTTTSASSPRPTCSASSCAALMPVSPAGGEQLAAGSPAVRGPVRRRGARGPLRQISSSPMPEQQAEQRAHPVTRRPAGRAAPARSKPARGEPLGVRRVAVGPDQPPVAGGEDVGGLDDVALGAAGQRDDLAHPAPPVGVGADVHDEVDARRDGRDDERRPDVLARQQRQRAHLDDGLAGAVGVQRAHAGQAGVQRDEQVEALLLAHLADDDAGRAASAAPP